MGAPFMIQSANGALTIDIDGASTEGSGIVGDPPGGGGGTPSQSWQVIPDPLGSNHSLIVSGASDLCIGLGAKCPCGRQRYR